MTVSESLTMLGYLLTDSNEEVWTSTVKLDALNSAQRELVLILLGFQRQYFGVYDLLNEIQEVETQSVGITGFSLSGMTERNFLRNGFVNASIIDDDGYTRWCERVATDKLGITENRYFEGTTRDPKCRITGAVFHLLIDFTSYPRNCQIFYIGMPYTLATAAAGSGKTQSVSTCDLNPLMHDLVVLMAEVKLRRMRGDAVDFQQAQFVSGFVQQQIQLLVSGAMGEPQTKTFGQFARQQADFMQDRMKGKNG